MQCNYYQQNKCSSCQWINIPYSTQLEKKQNKVKEALNPFQPLEFLPPIASEPSGFRNKAKMAVIGTVEKPILGMMHNHLAVDLCDCPLYSGDMQNVLKLIRTYIRKQSLVPYNIKKKTGELKFILVTESEHGLMLRFILRSYRYVEKIKASLNQLYDKIENLSIVSVNIQPVHAAILEGDEELVLSEKQILPITLNDVPLFIKPKSFFQTNTAIAGKLYNTASSWTSDLKINSIWDLFCGVGGFGLHCINHTKNENVQLTGIEISSDAIECALTSAREIGFKDLTFKSLDVTDYALAQDSGAPNLVLINPPRRGAGDSLMQYLDHVAPDYILYSSCHLTSLVSDLQNLSKYSLEKVQLFDMFPHTEHMEVLVLLSFLDNKTNTSICSVCGNISKS